jgi:hypothetical protein
MRPQHLGLAPNVRILTSADILITSFLLESLYPSRVYDIRNQMVHCVEVDVERAMISDVEEAASVTRVEPLPS